MRKSNPVKNTVLFSLVVAVALLGIGLLAPGASAAKLEQSERERGAVQGVQTEDDGRTAAELEAQAVEEAAFEAGQEDAATEAEREDEQAQAEFEERADERVRETSSGEVRGVSDTNITDRAVADTLNVLQIRLIRMLQTLAGR